MTHPTLADGYPGIARATLLIALDNGGINRNRSEAQQRKELEKFLQNREEPLDAMDAWLAALDDKQLEIACCGEQTEMLSLMAGAPVGTHEFLNAYFDEVC